MFVSPVHPLNALSPMVVTLSGILILDNPVHPLNALFPIVVTLLGMAYLVIPAPRKYINSPLLI